MFDLKSREATLTSYNPNSTKKGKDREPLATCNFRCNVSKETLCALDPQYYLFYTKRNGSQNDLADQMHDAPDLRFPLLTGPFDHFGESIGAELEIEIGPGGPGTRSNILLNVDVKKMKIRPMQGGTTELSFQVSFKPTERDGGKLSMLHMQKVTISLTPPEDTTGPIDAPEPGATKPTAKEAKAAAKAAAAAAFEGETKPAAAAH